MQIRKKGIPSRNRRVLAETEVAPEASELLLETEDAAQLIAEITGEDVEVTVDENTVTFAVGDEEYTCEAEGDEEVLESSSRPRKGMRRVSASTKARKPMGAGRSVRKLPRK